MVIADSTGMECAVRGKTHSTCRAFLRETDNMVGAAIRAKRIACGVSRKDLAAALKVHRDIVAEYELGKKPVPPGHLILIGIALDVDMVEFLMKAMLSASSRFSITELVPEQTKQRKGSRKAPTTKNGVAVTFPLSGGA